MHTAADRCELIVQGPELLSPNTLRLASLKGRGIDATNLTLIRNDNYLAAAAAAGVSYIWPAAAGAPPAQGAIDPNRWPAWLIAVVVVVALLALAAAFFAAVVAWVHHGRTSGAARASSRGGSKDVQGTAPGRMEGGGTTGSSGAGLRWGGSGAGSDTENAVMASNFRGGSSNGNVRTQGSSRSNSTVPSPAAVGGLGDVHDLESGKVATCPVASSAALVPVVTARLANARTGSSSMNSSVLQSLRQQQADGPGWQRVHNVISSMSTRLQHRRLQLQTGSSSSAQVRGGGPRSPGVAKQLRQHEPGQQPPHDTDHQQQQQLPLTAAVAAGDHTLSPSAPPPAAAVGIPTAAPTGPSPALGSPHGGHLMTYGQLSSSSSMATSSCADPGRLGRDVQLLEVIGCGSFGTVYRAAWRGRTVAVKLVHVPKSSGYLLQGWGRKGVGQALAEQLKDESDASQDKAERMALMEAVVSMSMQHPNIVRVFRYEVHPLAGDMLDRGARGVLQRMGVGGSGVRWREGCGGEQQEDDSLGWELRLVMEYCAQVRRGEELGGGGRGRGYCDQARGVGEREGEGDQEDKVQGPVPSVIP